MNRDAAREISRLFAVSLVAGIIAALITASCRPARGQEPPKPGVVVFGATWCPHCQKMKSELPKFQTASRDVLYIDVEREPARAAKWGVSVAGGIPVAVFVRPQDGKWREVSRVKGFTSPERFAQWVASSDRMP